MDTSLRLDSTAPASSRASTDYAFPLTRCSAPNFALHCDKGLVADDATAVAQHLVSAQESWARFDIPLAAGSTGTEAQPTSKASRDRLKRRREQQQAEAAHHDSEAAATRVAEGQWQDLEATSSELTMRDQQGGQTRIPTHEAAPEADSTSPHNSDAGRATSELDVAAHLTIPDEPQRWPHHRALTLRPQPLAALAPIMHSL